MICRIPKSYQKLSKHSYIDFGTATIMLCPRLFLLFLFICSRMDWFHCNQCFRKDGAHFFVTSCGHIFCKTCVTLEKCAVCGTACKHLALSDNLKPQEKMFFKSPVETALQYFSHISQVWSFQKKQTDLLVAFYKHRITKLETAMQEAQQALVSQDKELSVLRKENGELKKFLAILKLPHGPASSIAVKWSETPSPASTHSLSYRPSSASSGQGIFSFRPSPNGHSGHTRVLTPNNFAQRESRTTLESLPSFQLPVLQTLYQQQRQMGLPSGREAWTTSR
ncbi:RING finger protein 212B isoform X11 [Papio anubis]|uniref:RING finger protein 212B isoform X11 n=1 Tax=Papio anubis TaxID=9555 RepID=UPI000B7B714C|nr:RING finger protein 212B isoform X11 [Papio anubis]